MQAFLAEITWHNSALKEAKMQSFLIPLLYTQFENNSS
jgi:hypothetical protein